MKRTIKFGLISLINILLFSCAQPTSEPISDKPSESEPSAPIDDKTQEDELIHVTSVSFDEDEITLDIGDSYELDVNVLPINATNLDVTFSINDSSIASIEDGIVKALNSGRATITVTSVDNSNAKDTCLLIVNEEVAIKTLSSISVTGINKTDYYVGESIDLTNMIVVANYSDGSKITLKKSDYTVSGFDSSKPVNQQKITISYENKKYEFYVNILAKPLSNVLNEPLIGRQYYLNHIGDIYAVWQKYRGKGITIAVIDKAFDVNHEDFTFIDGTSKVSDKSASFVTNGSNTITNIGKNYAHDLSDSHGTFCAGVVAAGANNKGVIGIAPEATLMLLKTDGKPKSICAAFKYAADNGAKVITISIGSYYQIGGDLVDDGNDLSTVFNESVNYCYNKGVVICSAAGNGGLDNKPTEYTYPGAVDKVIGVGGVAANSSGDIWNGSSYNSSPQYQFADVFAPADMMFGCCNYDGKKYDGGWNGTSFASPIVAGMAALYFEKYPNNSASQFETALYNSCHALNALTDSTNHFGYGSVDVGRLLGEICDVNVTIKLNASWSNAYVYAWNLQTQNEIAEWPGMAMNKNSNIFELTINAGTYPNIVISDGNNKTVDLLSSSFIYEKTYSITNAINECNALVGQFI